MSVIAISPGDPAGIGPEVCLRALKKHKKYSEKFILIGDINHFEYSNKNKLSNTKL